LEVLGEIRRARGGGEARLVALSNLAEGADRLLAELVLEGGGALHAVLPLELSESAADFTSPESAAEFRALLGRADELIFAPPGLPAGGTPRSQQEREAAYEVAGRM